ncbi:hypothetical protein J4526_07425 [Desulfurococcaceae archaeon MEX13E-LK6-19]|nr:hypothetical protein J4526_07425 [Desulfurococcaceae archaeon MEX13E-LK6-19]
MIKTTYYDSSYIVSAIENNLILVTDDRKLINKIDMYKNKINEILNNKISVMTTRNLLEIKMG